MKSELVRILPIIGPLYLGSIAGCYDVGFFYGIGIGYFTIFSMTEHLVFALQALPFALIPAFSIIGTAFVPWHFWLKQPAVLEKYREAAKNMSTSEIDKELGRLNRRLGWYKIFNYPVHGLAVLLVTGSLYLGAYTSGVTLLATIVGINVVYPLDRFVTSPQRIAFIALLLISLGWITAYCVGYERARALMSSLVPTERISSGLSETSAIVVRSGDKGVLYKALPTNKIVFVRWDAIKRIEQF